jgi:hypothetical protein
LAFSLLVELALGAAPGEVRNGYRLAAKRILLVLEMEESAQGTGKTEDRLGGSGTDPKNESGERALESNAPPWGTCRLPKSDLPDYN